MIAGKRVEGVFELGVEATDAMRVGRYRYSTVPVTEYHLTGFTVNLRC